ncbi:MAG: hypothetical protein IJF68_03955, partial [Opitutales bacterium]|nr:hypothetical protein [Opitutales bacterium]
WGTQRAGFFSIPMYEELIVPPTKRIFDFLKSKGKYIELHSCGLCEKYVPYFIEMGVDSWTPQSCNDFDMLKREYGDKITFNFAVPGLDKPGITVEEAKAAARAFVDRFAGRGRVVAQVSAPNPEIGAAVYQEIYEYSSEHYAKLR